jgi:predicted XRE-type DNA-binding protein
MLKTNKDVRSVIKRSGFKQYMVAEKLGMEESQFSKLLRKELSQSEKEDIFRVIYELKKERKNEHAVQAV